ncbi:hypothetical protein VPNG_00188 [Neofusicoccum parvum]|uniref:Uncharacterized protein n=1 Tax=Neofusicoccum parvum TaxID=310453 RepID=A0ACB5RQP0_9PEZI|nr:hypothetical protein VPNG_00188 [Neofusicoccum parvum]
MATPTDTSPLSPLTTSLIRLVPVAATFAVTMCHLDQHLIFSSFASPTAASRGAHHVLPHTMRRYVRGVLPFVIALEAAAQSCMAAVVWQRGPLWRWYAVGLAGFFVHLANAPYAWRLLTAIRDDEAKAGRPEALARFVRMNKLRLVGTEVPLLVIVVWGALAPVVGGKV